MGSENIILMDDEGYEVSSLLQSIDVPRIEALSIACLFNVEELSSQDIERATGLRQPEVSVAMRSLYERGWIDERDDKRTKCRGRPAKYYSLKVDFADIIKVYESKILKMNEEKLKIIQDLLGMTI
ncbi:Predicted transcriptional regulator [Methanococcoides vulcani]|uniref:Predicted transcriptional regulator n=1 Tax=Methanococcoides vulcani TaxID=1353158 RepID=A0A1I0AS12_9EURY|nr:transcriptional regulator [Methanococcoides vulcani]SES97177.1 Predicted transcriptional regulator [Methanococcoides vulcani]